MGTGADLPGRDPGHNQGMAATSKRGPGPVQQQRSAETREAAIRATVELLVDGGVAAATAAAISERSGVSWGGIQHQFGGKDAVLDATLDHVVGELAALWDPPPDPAGSLEGRARALVDLVWRTVGHPHYPALVELLRQRASRADGIDGQVLRLRGGTGRVTAALFADLDLGHAALDLVDSFCFAAVGGIADQQRVARPSAAFTERSLDLVVAGILAALDPT